MVEIIEFPSQGGLLREEISQALRDEIEKLGYGEDSVRAFLEHIDFILNAAEETVFSGFEIEVPGPDRPDNGMLEIAQALTDEIHGKVETNIVRFLTLILAHMLCEYFPDPPPGKRRTA